MLTDQEEMSNLCKEPYIDASSQFWFDLALQFQRRCIFFESANRKKELPVAAIFVDGKRRNEQSL